MISLKEYAKNKNISYEAVRQQVNRYKGELKGHISKVERTQYLDSFAVEFLDSKRAVNPVVIMETNKDAEIKRLEEENKALLVKVAAQADKIAELSNEKADNAQKLALAEVNQLLLEEKKEEIDELKNELKSAQEVAAEKQIELDKFEKTLFGLYKKKS